MNLIRQAGQRVRCGYDTATRERALDLMLDGLSLSHVARVLDITWPTLDRWLKEYRLVEAEIERHLHVHTRATLTLEKSFSFSTI